MDHNGQYPYPYPCMAQRAAPSANTYSTSYAQATRPGGGPPQASLGLDMNRDGRIDHVITGADYNHDGIPDMLQQGYTHPAHGEVEEPLRVSMIVPEDAGPGTKLQYTAPDGQELRLTVPDGVPPGSVMTLTQDPVTKAWKCMAEPADQPPAYEPPPQRYSGAGVQNYSTSGGTATTERITKYVAGSPPVITYQAPSAPRIIGSTMQTMPVNLSYVPPPVMPGPPQVHYSAGPTYAAPVSGSYGYSPPRPETTYTGAVIYDQRPSYTPPPVMLEQRPSYTPPPMPMMEQRPSYTPMPQILPGMQVPPPVLDPSLLASTTRMQPSMIIGGSSSYVPPPVLVQNTGSYVPPPGPMPMAHTTVTYEGGATFPAGMLAQGPSITTLPSHQPPLQPQYGQQPYSQPPVYGQPPPPQLGAPFGHQPGPGFGLGGVGLPPLPGLQPPMGIPPMGGPQQPGQPWGHPGSMPPLGLQPPAPLFGLGQMPMLGQPMHQGLPQGPPHGYGMYPPQHQQHQQHPPPYGYEGGNIQYSQHMGPPQHH